MKSIIVTGDVVRDCHFYEGERANADSSRRRGFRPQVGAPGGALRLCHLIKEVLAPNPECRVEFGLDIDLDKLPDHYHAYSLWRPQAADPQEQDPAKRTVVWRAVEPPLGYGHPDESAHAAASFGRRRDLLNPDILVIDDAGLNFRKADSKDRWPFDRAAGGACPEWVVLKQSGSIGAGALWEEISRNGRDNLIVIISADQLRRSDCRIGRGLSWEATVEDLMAELAGNHLLRPLGLARHLIVTFQSDGAFWLENPAAGAADRTPRAMLVFDGAGAEGEWAATQGDGTVFGYLSCFTAAVVAELSLADKDNGPDFVQALSKGLAASRELLRLGHGPVMIKEKDDQGREREVVNPDPGFPLSGIAAAVRRAENKFVSTPLPIERLEARRGKWMMLDEWQVRARGVQKPRPYFQAAFAAAILGPGALERFPVARFRDLRTVDRQEIESLRIIRRLISDYENKAPRDAKPLNIGVFGPPGAGKSFGVKEISRAVLGEKVPFLTFNLSQFVDPTALNGALHQVRDKVLAGATPVVFWDEFDSENYRWLQYLLAPMNDGVFQDNQITHPVGKCVFIFAGATSSSYETFGPPDPNDPDHPDHGRIGELKSEHGRRMSEAWNAFVLKKGPDFKSRLVAYLNVLGPNPGQIASLQDDGRYLPRTDPEDLCWPIRRAFFIRDKFKLKDAQRLEIDEGVLNALLEIPRYKSGSRSLEFLCAQLREGAKGRIPRRSHLPGHHLLKMHVDAAEFWRICERDSEFLPFGPVLAPALHEAYRLRIKGREDKKHLDVPFGELPEDMQAANRGQALRIPQVLRIAGMTLVRGDVVPLDQLALSRDKEPGEADLRARLAEPGTLDLLAEAEHNGWMVERMLRGWRYAPRRVDEKRLHDNLIPYNQLPPKTQAYDRKTIVGEAPPAGQPHLEQFGYVDLVKTAGFRIALLPST